MACSWFLFSLGGVVSGGCYGVGELLGGLLAT